ncbi:transcription initiation factor TFIID subunit 4 isoform X2 [Thrips palmi]|uniref:Transcription initiation factor TFIID subunit 4 isoform X2 n=1 Tax=Thrips palmi TaxID=161013 RepID=A0A6P9ACF3_THRPL|nr:transcription initiation factor TFIID subunit 4 isoform X2 [Thrips palmi]
MASANFLEEALSTDVDDSAVSAIVGSLENNSVTSAVSASSASATFTGGIKNHVNSAVSNGAPVSSEKHSPSPVAGAVNNIILNDASQTNTIQTSNLGQIKVIASVPGEVTSRPTFVNQVTTSSIGLTQTTLANLSKGQEPVRILVPTSSQTAGGMNINNARLPLTTQHVGALQNGSVALTSLPSQTVVNPTTTVVSQNQLSTSANVIKQIPQTIGVINALDPTKAGASTVVLKASGNQLATTASIASAVMPVPMSVNSSAPMTATSINSVVTGSTVTTSGTSVMTLSKPLTQSVTAIGSQGNLLSGNVQILNVNALRQTTPGMVPPKGPLRVVSGTPIRAAGGVQGITLQALQSLPGTQNLLIKTENGFQLVRVGPGTGTATATALGAGSHGNATQTLRLQSFPGLSSVALTASTSGTTATVNSITTQVPVPALSTPTTAATVVTSAVPVAVTQAAPPAQPRPAQVDTTKEKCRKFLANLLELSSREPKSVERNVRSLIQELVDCKVEPEEFCERLERLLNASPQPCLIGFLKKSLPLLRQAMVTKELVIEGIRPPPANVMYSTVTSAVTTPVVSCPPLQATQIRPAGLTTQTVRVVTPVNATNAASIVGGMQGPRHVTVQHRLVTVPITTSASGIVTQPVATSVVTSQPSPVASPIPASSIATVPVTMSAQVLCRPGTPGTLQLQPRAIMPIKQVAAMRPQTRPLSPVIRTPTPIRVTTPLNKATIVSKAPPKLTAAQQRMQAKGMVTIGTAGIAPDLVNSGSVSTVLTMSTAAAAHSVNSSIAAPIVSSVTSLAGVGASAMGVTPVVSAPMSSGTPTTVISSLATTATTVFAPGSQISRTISKEKDKKPVGVTPATAAAATAAAAAAAAASSSYTGDDDINDVAAMGGVNIIEETQRILGSTDFVGTQIRSCKDDIFLHSPTLQQKIRNIAIEQGLDEPTADVAALISHAAQERLKNFVEKLAVIAEHRMDIIKLDPRYEVSQDVKGQLKFLEELDRMERKRNEEKERELLLRAAKSRSKSEDPEQAKLKAKAKEMQRAEMEEVRQREANMTALQAIGPRKKPRLDGSLNDGSVTTPGNGATTTSNGTASGRPQLPSRPRVKRVNIRDLVFLLEQEKESCRSTFLYKAYLK